MNYSNSLTISIVCYYPEKDEITELLNSLYAAIRNLDVDRDVKPIKIYLIDNSEDSSFKLSTIESVPPISGVEVSIVAGHGNIGYGRGHNKVLQLLNSEYHLMMNSDIVVDPFSLFHGIEYLKQNPSTALATPLAHSPSGERLYLSKLYPSVLTLMLRGFGPKFLKSLFRTRLSRYEMTHLEEIKSDDNVKIISGCFMLCSTQVLRKVGGFDSKYFLYFEDFDLSLRISKISRLAYVPKMKIEHRGGNTSKKGLSHILMFLRSSIKFYNSHGWRWIKQ